MAIAEHGALESWGWKNPYSNEEKDEFVKNYFVPYLNAVRFCSASNPNSGCFDDVTYKALNGSASTNFARRVNSKLLLADGAAVDFFLFPSCFENGDKCLSLYIDTNGARKPNTIGLDLFIFSYYPQVGEFFPAGVYKDNSYNEETKSFTKISRDEVYKNCNETRSGTGWFCGLRIIEEGFKINY